MYLGVCMPVCLRVWLRVAYAYVKPTPAHAIHMVPHITNWLFRPCTVFIRVN